MNLLVTTEEILFNHKDLVQTFIQRQTTHIQKNSSHSGSYPSSINSGQGEFIL
jgi:hypothetical protein